MITNKHVTATLLLALSSLADAGPQQPGAPAPANPNEDPLGWVELRKLNLSKQDRQQKFQALQKAIYPPGSGSTMAFDTGGMSDVLNRFFTWWAPERQSPPGWGGGQGNGVSTWLDFGIGPTEILRVARVYRCLPPHKNGKFTVDVSTKLAIATFAVCHMDMQKLSRDGYEKDLAADPRFNNDFVKAIARDRFNVVKRDADAMLAAYTEKAKTDATFKQVVFEIPEKLAADWEADYAAHKQEIDAAREIVHQILADVPNRRGMKDIGCGKTLHPILTSYVRSKKPKAPPDVLAALVDNVGYPILQATMLCDAYEGRYASARAELWVAQQAGQRLGPRSAAAFGLVAAIQDLEKAGKPIPFVVDDLRVGMDEFTHTKEVWADNLMLSSDDRDLPIDDTAGGAKEKKFHRGVLVSAKPTARGVELAFKKETWKVPAWDCVKTRIKNWESDGTPIWDYSCKPATPPFYTESNQHMATTVGDWLAPTFKPNQLVQLIVYQRRSDKVVTGFPMAVWSNKDRKKMVMAYGIPLD